MPAQPRQNRHTPGHRPFTLRCPMDLYRWLHRTSVLKGRTKTALMADAVDWVRAQPHWVERLRTVAIGDNGRRRSSTFDWPEETYLWLRIESSEHGWSTNELAIRALLAWRAHQDSAKGGAR